MRTLSVVLLMVFSLSSVSPAGSSSPSLSSEIDALVRHYVTEYDFMGSILVADHGEVVFTRGYGLANVDEGTPNTPETRFMIGSITKQFTAMLIMLLVEGGQLSLDDLISDVLPSFPRDVGERITIAMLLSHRSGLRLPEGIESYYHLSTQEEYILQVLADGLRFPPDEGYGYSNAGYHVLAMIIEEVTGRRYEEVLQEQILDPLGMSSTGCNRKGRVIENRAYSYTKLPGAYITWSEDHSHNPRIVFFGSGFMYSTVNDLFKFSQALCSNELLSGPNTDQFLRVRTRKERPPIRLIPAALVERMLGSCGCGFVGEICRLVDPETNEEQTLIWHDGTCKLFKAYHYRYREKERSIIILSNCSLRGEGDEIALRINELLDGRPHESLRFKRHLMQYVEEDVATHAGIPVAVDEYARLKADTLRFAVPGMRYMVGIGREVVRLGDCESAIRLFQMTLEEWPQSWEAHDALGDTYLLIGENDLAAESFMESLKLNAENDHALEMLRGLEGK